MRFQDYYEAALRHGWFDPCFYLDVMQSRGIAMPEGAPRALGLTA